MVRYHILLQRIEGMFGLSWSQKNERMREAKVKMEQEIEAHNDRKNKG